MTNLATEYLRTNQQTVADWDGACGELADKIISDKNDIIYVEGEMPASLDWRYHMVPLIDGLIHDAWCPGDALPLKEWLAKMFEDGHVEVSLNGDTLYAGPADEFRGIALDN